MFINHVIFGVFQYDLGPPKHTLELRNFVLINVFSLHLIGPNGENWGFEGIFISFFYTFSRLFQVGKTPKKRKIRKIKKES